MTAVIDGLRIGNYMRFVNHRKNDYNLDPVNMPYKVSLILTV